MIIELRTIPEGSRRYEFRLERDWWSTGDQHDPILAFKSPLDVKITVYKAGDKYILEGNLRGSFLVRCDRCLEPFHKDLKSVFRSFLALPLPDLDNTEVELVEEDMEVDFIRGEEIDLGEIIREKIYLSLPMKLLCREDCPGLCSNCGKNLNKGDCHCRQERGHPAFLKLKGIKIKGE